MTNEEYIKAIDLRCSRRTFRNIALDENSKNVIKDLVNHINENRKDNRVENLEWVTPKENVIHSFRFGSRRKCKQVPKRTLLTDFQISQIDILRKSYTVKQIAKLFNIEYQSLKNIIHKKKQCERLDNQQPSIYNSIYEGSETIPNGSKQ